MSLLAITLQRPALRYYVIISANIAYSTHSPSGSVDAELDSDLEIDLGLDSLDNLTNEMTGSQSHSGNAGKN